MGRLRLTFDEGTSEALARHARQQGKPRAVLTQELTREAIKESKDLQEMHSWACSSRWVS